MLSFLNCIYFNDYCIENLISSDYVWLGLPFLSCSFNQSIPWTFTLWSYLNFYIRSVSFYNSLDIYTFTPIVLLNLHFEHVKSSNEMSSKLLGQLEQRHHSTNSFRKIIYIENHIHTKSAILLCLDLYKNRQNVNWN